MAGFFYGLCSFLLAAFFVTAEAYDKIPEDAKTSDKKDISAAVIKRQAPPAESRLGKNTVLNISGNGAEETKAVLVDKSLKRMYIAVLKGDNMEVVKEYSVLTGRMEGDKQLRGDEKTPEGVYYVLSYSSGDQLVKRYGSYALIYGAGSFPLNYPNIVDKIHKKTGGGIWLHGTKPDLDKTYTQGCVAMNNADFTDMANWTKITTPVIISEKLAYASNAAEFEKNRRELLNIFETFIKSWRENDAGTFTDSIHTDFKTPSGINKKKYVKGKTDLMKIYPDREIDNYNTKIFMKDANYTVFDTNQFYCASNLVSYSNKRYYFTEESGKLKLMSEEVRPLSLSLNPMIANDISGFLNMWIDAWKSQNINSYMTFYDKAFKDGKDRYDDWRTKKELIFEKNAKISVKISDIKWSISKGVWSVSFLQEYSSGDYSDKGRKTLILTGCPKSFKIISEKWSSI